MADNSSTYKFKSSESNRVQLSESRLQNKKTKPNANYLEDNRPGTVAQLKLRQTLNKKTNDTGLPDQLKKNVEHISGFDMDDVKVHYNSNKPAQLSAHAYAKGTDIHLGPGQEKHLPHEIWHVVQQKQGRVKPTIQKKSMVNINDDITLEKEADRMGAKISNQKSTTRF